MASKIEITFNAEALDGESISFQIYKFVTPASLFAKGESFQDADRTSNGQIKVVTTVPLHTVGSATAIEYAYYFNIDYNGSSLFNITRLDNVVTLEFTNDEWGFTNFISDNTFITSNITNYNPQTFSIVDILMQTASTDTCNKVGVSIETNELATKVTLNSVLLTATNTNNPFLYDVDRGINNTFLIENATGNQLSFLVLPFGYLTSENISVNIVQYHTGATLTVSVINAQSLVLEYSLDNINWQVSNIFTGQDIGNKFLYVRDQYGCVKSKEYTVTESGTRVPFHYISIANSINFSLEEVADGCSIFKTDENTLQYQELVKYNYCNKLLFQTCDYTTTQIKSNFESVTATLRDSLLNETSLTISKKTNNLNKFKSLDAKYYKYRTGKLGIYFDTGNLYDDNGVDIGDYTLNGNLPEFAILGKLVSLDGLGVFEIVDILYDEVKNKKVIIVDYTFEGLDTAIIVAFLIMSKTSVKVRSSVRGKGALVSLVFEDVSC